MTTREPYKSKYAPFKQIESNRIDGYDLCLVKDGIKANIIKNTIVSVVGTDDMNKYESIIDELKILGFKLP